GGQCVNMLEQKKPDHKNCVAIPGRPPSLYSGAISPSMNSQSILPASCTSSCLMLMIWSSRARSRSPDPVVSCFFGRIAPSDAATESCFSIRGNRENEFASFQGLRHGKLAISSQQSRQKRLSLSGLEILHGRLEKAKTEKSSSEGREFITRFGGCGRPLRRAQQDRRVFEQEHAFGRSAFGAATARRRG